MPATLVYLLGGCCTPPLLLGDPCRVEIHDLEPTATIWVAPCNHSCCGTWTERMPTAPGTYCCFLGGTATVTIAWVTVPLMDLGEANAHALHAHCS